MQDLKGGWGQAHLGAAWRLRHIPLTPGTGNSPRAAWSCLVLCAREQGWSAVSWTPEEGASPGTGGLITPPEAWPVRPAARRAVEQRLCCHRPAPLYPEQLWCRRSFFISRRAACREVLAEVAAEPPTALLAKARNLDRALRGAASYVVQAQCLPAAARTVRPRSVR